MENDWQQRKVFTVNVLKHDAISVLLKALEMGQTFENVLSHFLVLTSDS